MPRLVSAHSQGGEAAAIRHSRAEVFDPPTVAFRQGLTVYRDQRFTADRTAPALKRIKDAVLIQSAQFAEDAGGMGHAIRPESYM